MLMLEVVALFDSRPKLALYKVKDMSLGDRLGVRKVKLRCIGTSVCHACSCSREFITDTVDE